MLKMTLGLVGEFLFLGLSDLLISHWWEELGPSLILPLALSSDSSLPSSLGQAALPHLVYGADNTETPDARIDWRPSPGRQRPHLTHRSGDTSPLWARDSLGIFLTLVEKISCPFSRGFPHGLRNLWSCCWPNLLFHRGTSPRMTIPRRKQNWEERKWPVHYYSLWDSTSSHAWRRHPQPFQLPEQINSL